MADFEQQIGPFRLYSEVGRTPISNKYRATDSRNGETVALHILTADAAQQPALVQQFLAIGHRAMGLRHPGIVPIVDTGEIQDFVYVATQWVRGQSLGERLRRTGRTVDIETAAYVINALAATLDYAHSQGFTHGHITLDQIYITDDNSIMLDGFAEAVRLTTVERDQDGNASEETITNPLVFISPFIAPEQAQSGNTFDFRVDIYSLGAVLYTMLLGRPPFVAEESGELLAQIVERQPAPPEMINPSLPAAMVYVLKLALAKDPTMRYASAGEFANAFLQSSQWHALIPAGEGENDEERRGFAPMLLFALAALLSFVLIVGVGLGWLGDRFAFLQRSDGTGLLAQVGDLWPQAGIPGQAMDDPTALTPVVLLTTTPSMTLPIAQLTVALPTEAGIQLSGIAESPAISATTPAITATEALATPILVEIPTLVATPVPTDTTNGSEAASSLVMDPFGLLTDAVAAGEVAINGTAAPGTPIQLQVNGRNSGSTTTKATGTWSFIVSLEQPGDYEIIAQMLDGNGNVTETTQRIVTVTNGTEAQTVILTPTVTLTVTLTVPLTVPLTATIRAPVLAPATETPTALPTATSTVTPSATPSATLTVIPTVTNTPIPPTATFTRTPMPTATATNTATNTAVPTVTFTNTPVPTATHTATATATSTAVPTVTFTNTPVPTATHTATATATSTAVPTATFTNTPVPTATHTATATATNTAVPTATFTNTPVPTATNTPLPTATNTRLPTVTATRTPLPTATATNTALPTATATNTATNTPLPTATNTPVPTATNTPRPTATNTPRPTATNTPRPTATNTLVPTATNTPRPTATNTPRQTATTTLRSTATNTPRPTATNTPVPTATMTPLPTATNTPLPPPTNTRPPTATNTPAPTATPTTVVGVIDPVAPGNGESGGGQRVFSWSANFTPPPDTAFELVFWKPGQDPLANSIGLAAPTTNLNVTLDLERLDEQLGALFDTGEYNWGVLLVRTTPAYERVKYLGGGRIFTYYRGGDPGSGGPSSGE